MGTKVIIFIAWILLTLGVVSLGTTMMTLPDTLANIAGVFVLTLWGVLSFKTRCFVKVISIINKFKNKKDNEK
ncbi:hypothetical protein [Bacteroides pyogenes]|uniref:hypothetical protein n=1 Tax=Bacteroides pyogenes TaxID=310300 RepID=UPI002FDA85D5